MDEQPSTSRISNGDKLDSQVDKENAQRYLYIRKKFEDTAVVIRGL